jgi:hypothetical protein
MSTGSVEDLRAMIKADPECTDMVSESYTFYYCPDPGTWEKKTSLVGSGQCVALVQAAANLPHTSLWKRGPEAKENAAIPVGTVIATFDDKGKYPSHSTGNHAAIFISESDEGIVVRDQWKNKTDPPSPSRRTLQFRDGKGSASNDGDRFWVVLTANLLNQPNQTH